MYKLTTAVSKSSSPLRAAALVSVFACLALTGCAAPRKPDGPERQEPARIVADLAEYARWLTRQPAPQLQAELERLRAEPPSATRSLRLALLHAQRDSLAYDPELSAHLLGQLAATEPQSSVPGQLAQLLFSGQPDPQLCADAERLGSLTRDLAAQLSHEQQQVQQVQDQLHSARTELESERTERARLERQLKALKSLEAEMQGRDHGGAY